MRRSIPNALTFTLIVVLADNKPRDVIRTSGITDLELVRDESIWNLVPISLEIPNHIWAFDFLLQHMGLTVEIDPRVAGC